MYSVYTLSDPRTKQVRYVGMSTDPYNRYGQHLMDRGNKSKSDWILDLRENGIMPSLAILESGLTRKQASEREVYWIRYYLKLGIPLTNASTDTEILKETCKLKLCIKEIATEQGLNRNQLQLKSGVTLPLLNRYWANNITEIKLDALEKIANALGVDPKDLLVLIET